MNKQASMKTINQRNQPTKPMTFTEYASLQRRCAIALLEEFEIAQPPSTRERLKILLAHTERQLQSDEPVDVKHLRRVRREAEHYAKVLYVFNAWLATSET